MKNLFCRNFSGESTGIPSAIVTVTDTTVSDHHRQDREKRNQLRLFICFIVVFLVAFLMAFLIVGSHLLSAVGRDSLMQTNMLINPMPVNLLGTHDQVVRISSLMAEIVST